MKRNKLHVLFLLASVLCSFISHAQYGVYATSITDSSSDFRNSYRIVDNDKTNYGYVSDTIGLLGTSYVRVGFPTSGRAGDVISIIVRGTGQVLGLDLISNITLRLYDSLGTQVATGTGASLLKLSLLSPTDSIYAIRFIGNPTDDYRFKQARIEFNNLLSVNLLNQFRVYGIYYEPACPARLATSVYAFGTNGGLFTGYVNNPNNAVDNPDNNFATLNMPLDLLTILPPAYLDLQFSSVGRGGEFVGFTIAQATALLNVDVLPNLAMTVYDESGTVVDSKNNFNVADLRLLDGSTTKYMLGFTTQPGNYNIARVRLTMNGVLSLLQDLNVYNAFHFRAYRPPVAIIASGPTNTCLGNSITLTAIDSLGGNTYLWNTGATTQTITVNTTGIYSVEVMDPLSCSRFSVPIAVNFNPIPITIGGTNGTLCEGTTATLSAPAGFSSYLWNNGNTGSTLTITGPGRYYVKVTDGSGCIGTDTVDVQQNSLSITPTITNAGCDNMGGAIALDITGGGSGNYTYRWSNGGTTSSIGSVSAGLYPVTITDNVSDCIYNRVYTVAMDSVLGVQSSVVNTSGAGKSDGKIVVAITGGSGNYSYLWSNGATASTVSDVSAGIYSLVATDNVSGCVAHDTFIVQQGTSPLDITTNVTASNGCSTPSGSITVNVTGGSSNYSYLWSTGATTATISNLMPGIYYVLVTDNNNGATKGMEVVVGNTGVLTINETITQAACNMSNGAIDVTVSNGSGNYTYNWSNGATTTDISGLNAGIYILTVTDATNGCVRSKIFTITTTATPQVTFTTINPNPSINTKGSITVNAGSGDYRYLWSNGSTEKDQSNLSAGTYALTVTDNATGCITIYTIVLNNVPPLVVVASPESNTDCFNYTGAITLKVSGGVPSYSYTWSNGATSDMVAKLPKGMYKVTVKDAVNSSNSVDIPVSGIDCPDVAGGGVIIHDVITPNGDGLNDQWVIEGIHNFPNNNIKIFDKWGDVLAEQSNYNNTWAGTNKNNELLPTGTYYYILKLNGTMPAGVKSEYAGFITIRR